MALPVRTQLTYWGIAALVFIALLYLMGNVILPFVLGGAIAYMLDPIADWLERCGLSRIWATVVITALAALAFAALAILLLPLLIDQATQLIETAPEMARNLQTALNERFPSLVDSESTLRRSIAELGETIRARGVELLQGVVSSALSLVNVMVLLVIVPVVAFYLLMDWDRMVARINALLPLDHAPTIRMLAHQIDRTLAAFIRGQGLVCAILGTYYAVALLLVGLQFGVFVGFVAGLISFIPYVGAIVGGGLALGLGIFQFWGEWGMLALVAVIFFSGQMVEGNVLTPNLVGSSVGLHPVWLLFALSAFGSFFGFLGLLVAVPVAASIGVIVRWAIGEYQAGPLYKGIAGRQDEE